MADDERQEGPQDETAASSSSEEGAEAPIEGAAAPEGAPEPPAETEAPPPEAPEAPAPPAAEGGDVGADADREPTEPPTETPEPAAAAAQPPAPDAAEATPEAAEGAPEPAEAAPEAADAAAEAGQAAEAPEPAAADAAAEAGQAAEAPQPAAAEAEGQEPSAGAEGEAPPRERPRRPRRRGEEGEKTEEVVPGAHLEPDLVLEEQRVDDEFARYGVEDEEAPAGDGETATEEPAPVARTPMDLAADARYRATGKRKTAVARVILRPGSGTYLVNGRALEEFFPRDTLRLTARQPLETAGYATQMDVVAKIHGGGVSSQAGALRHGIARALVEADPNLRGELKRRGFLTRDARVKERKKAGLKKARKRPQFSKR